MKAYFTVLLLVVSLAQPSMSGAVLMAFIGCCCHDTVSQAACCETETQSDERSCEEEEQCNQCYCSARTFVQQDEFPAISQPAMVQCEWQGFSAELISYTERPQAPPPKLS